MNNECPNEGDKGCHEPKVAISSRSESEKIIQQEMFYCAQNSAPLPVVLDRGEGVWLWDKEGKRYLDMMSAYSAVSHGHCHPRLVKVLSDQAEKLGVVSRAYHSEPLSAFLKKG